MLCPAVCITTPLSWRTLSATPLVTPAVCERGGVRSKRPASELSIRKHSKQGPQAPPPSPTLSMPRSSSSPASTAVEMPPEARFAMVCSPGRCDVKEPAACAISSGCPSCIIPAKHRVCSIALSTKQAGRTHLHSAGPQADGEGGRGQGGVEGQAGGHCARLQRLLGGPCQGTRSCKENAAQ